MADTITVQCHGCLTKYESKQNPIYGPHDTPDPEVDNRKIISYAADRCPNCGSTTQYGKPYPPDAKGTPAKK